MYIYTDFSFHVNTYRFFFLEDLHDFNEDID